MPAVVAAADILWMHPGPTVDVSMWVVPAAAVA
jgi:hypothetical protein